AVSEVELPSRLLDSCCKGRVAQGHGLMASHRSLRKALTVTALIVGGLGLLGFFSCAGLLTWGQGQIREAEVAGNAFLELLATGRVDEAYNATATEFQNTVTREQFAELIKTYPMLTSHASRTND